MNIKKAKNSQLSTTESKKQSKQTTRTGTDSYRERSFGDYQLGGGRGRMGGKVQALRSKIGRYKLDRGRLITV